MLLLINKIRILKMSDSLKDSIINDIKILDHILLYKGQYKVVNDIYTSDING